MEDPAVPYPLHREVDVVLRDGATVRIRPARADDRERACQSHAAILTRR